MGVTALRTYIAPRYKMVPVLADAVIGRGAAIGITAAGFARELQAGDQFAGFAEEDIDVTGEASGDYRIRVVTAGRVKIAVTGASAATVNDAVYASATNTFTTTSTSNSRIGKIAEHVSGTSCWVEFKSDSDV